MPQQTSGRSWKDFEREGWQRNAPSYDDRAGRMTSSAIPPLLEAVEARPGMSLLDICCGPGYAAGAAAARGLAAVGVDLAPAMVVEAQRRCPAAAFDEGDAEALKFADGSFDAAVCAFGLLHLPSAEQALGEACRVLRPGGRYAFTVWCQPEQARLLGLALKAITAHADMNVPLPPAPSMFHYSDAAVGRAALERAGFRDVAVRTLPIDFEGRSPADVFDWFDKSAVRTMALYRLQSPQTQSRIKEEILAGAEAFRQGEGVTIPCPALLYSAQKP
jgi:ubiquinone/menaquinone biosynthesis C-methylase UbiE